MKNVESEEGDDLRPEYDFSQMKGGVRGKYVERYRQGTNLLSAGNEDKGQSFVRPHSRKEFYVSRAN